MKLLGYGAVLALVLVASAFAIAIPEEMSSDYGENPTIVSISTGITGVTGERVCSSQRCPGDYVFDYQIGDVTNFVLTLTGELPFTKYGVLTCGSASTVRCSDKSQPGIAAALAAGSVTVVNPTTLAFTIPVKGSGLVFYGLERQPDPVPDSPPGNPRISLEVVAATPEPGPIALVLTGFVSVIVLRRTQRKRN